MDEYPIALCLGGAKCVWDDLGEALAITAGLPVVIIACNQAGIAYHGRIDAWATLHSEYFDLWRAERRARGGNDDYRAFIHRDCAGPSVEFVAQEWHGSSGLYMAQIAIRRLQARAAILCGVPMDDDFGHIVQPGPWGAHDIYRPGFLAAKAAGMPIRSMSGWTRELFGAPYRFRLEDLQSEKRLSGRGE